MHKRTRPEGPENTVYGWKNGLYFNGIQLRGAVRAIASRIRSVSKTGRVQIWHLSCLTDGCQNTCRYYSGSVQKGVNSEHCDACRFPELQRVYTRVIDGERRSKTVIRANSHGRGHKPNYYVNCETCTDSFSLANFIGPMKRLHCFPCHKKYRTVFGQYLASQSMWRLRHQLRAPKYILWRGRKRLIWHIKCRIDGCDNDAQLRSSTKRLTCMACRYDSRAMPDFEAMYRAHIRQDKQRAIKKPDWAATELTLRQFVKAMQDKQCHYCHKIVQRHTRLKHTTETGKRMSASVFLDRLDASQPYRVDNIVTCCHGCNIIKNAYLTEQEMVYIMAQRTRNTQRATESHKRLSEGYSFPDAIDVRLRKRGGHRKTVES